MSLGVIILLGKLPKSRLQLFRFLEEYHKNGIKIWGITLQNEPYTGLDPLWGWQTMYLGADMQR